MYQAGLIDQRKDGRWAYYSVSDKWQQQNAAVDNWLSEQLKDSARVRTDAVRLMEILAMSLDQLCQPQDQCLPDKPVRGKRGVK